MTRSAGRNPVALGDPERVLRETLGCAPGDIAHDVILTPFFPLKAFARHVDEGSVRELAPEFFYQGFSATRRARPVTVLLTGVGPSRVGDCASLLSLTPARRLLFVGAVGGLHPDWAIGDFCVPEEAADGEGYARYRRDGFEKIVADAVTLRCEGGLEGELAQFLRARGAVVRGGKVFTIGSIAVECRENLETLALRGFDALEMELSAFYAAAGHHGFAAAALTYVSDLPLRSSLWEAKRPEEQTALRAAWRATPLHALEFLLARPVAQPAH